MFVIDDILIAAIVVPVAQRLGNRWLDQIADAVDEGLKRLLRRVVDAAAVDDPNRRRALTATAEGELRSYVAQHPEVRPELGQIFTPRVEAVDASPRGLAQAIFDFLAYLFTIVEYLEQPVALPGFLTGENDLIVVDVRVTRKRYANGFRLPSVSWEGPFSDDEDPSIFFHVENAMQIDVPRLWLMQTGSPEERQSRILSLNEGFYPTDPLPGGLESHLKDEWRVDSISPYEVKTTKRFASGEGTTHRVAGDAGIVLLQNSLVDAVEAAKGGREKLLSALAVPTGPDRLLGP
jgi:hypothetical protein